MDQANVEKLKLELEIDEGFVDHVYRDTHGNLTFGIGRCNRISRDEALVLLSNDIADIWKQLVKRLPWIVNLDAARQRVIINLTFNLGVQGLLGFQNMLEKLRKGDFKGAGDEIVDSVAGRELANRYSRLADRMRIGGK